MLIIDLAESEVFCMRRENKTRHVIIKEGTPEEMNKEINEIFETPNLISHRLTYLDRPGMFAAIEYTTEVVVYENIKEEMEARGEIYLCDECPYLEPITDRRHHVNKCRCGTTTPMKRACALFYEEMVKGELEVVKR